MDAFTIGEEFSVAEDPFRKASDALLARVHPIEDEIWDFRIIAPYDGLRCFGRFVGLNIFVALTWEYRENINGEIGWHHEVERCKEAWWTLFGYIEPFRGNRLDEYLTNFWAV